MIVLPTAPVPFTTAVFTKAICPFPSNIVTVAVALAGTVVTVTAGLFVLFKVNITVSEPSIKASMAAVIGIVTEVCPAGIVTVLVIAV